MVLCNPLGYEAMSVHRTYRHLAQQLASSGFYTLRFDYDGTGDSSGTPHDPGRLRAWLDSIAAAVAEVRSRTGSPQVALFGVRFGATLATLAAASRGRRVFDLVGTHLVGAHSRPGAPGLPTHATRDWIDGACVWRE